MRSRTALLILCFVAAAAYGSAATVSPLLARGYTVMPEPQKVELRSGDFRFGPGWKLDLGPGLDMRSIAPQTLNEELNSWVHVSLGGVRSQGSVRLEVAPGSVTPGRTQDREPQRIAEQAYRIQLAPDHILIRANAEQGLFYGVETLIQLLRLRDG